MVIADALTSNYLQVGTVGCLEKLQGHTYGRLVVHKLDGLLPVGNIQTTASNARWCLAKEAGLTSVHPLPTQPWPCALTLPIRCPLCIVGVAKVSSVLF
jgi:hypothetical protein